MEQLVGFIINKGNRDTVSAGHLCDVFGHVNVFLTHYLPSVSSIVSPDAGHITCGRSPKTVSVPYNSSIWSRNCMQSFCFVVNILVEVTVLVLVPTGVLGPDTASALQVAFSLATLSSALIVLLLFGVLLDYPPQVHKGGGNIISDFPKQFVVLDFLSESLHEGVIGVILDLGLLLPGLCIEERRRKGIRQLLKQIHRSRHQSLVPLPSSASQGQAEGFAEGGFVCILNKRVYLVVLQVLISVRDAIIRGYGRHFKSSRFVLVVRHDLWWFIDRAISASTMIDPCSSQAVEHRVRAPEDDQRVFLVLILVIDFSSAHGLDRTLEDLVSLFSDSPACSSYPYARSLGLGFSASQLINPALLVRSLWLLPPVWDGHAESALGSLSASRTGRGRVLLAMVVLVGLLFHELGEVCKWCGGAGGGGWRQNRNKDKYSDRYWTSGVRWYKAMGMACPAIVRLLAGMRRRGKGSDLSLLELTPKFKADPTSTKNKLLTRMDQIQVAFLIRILSICYLAGSFSSGFNPVDNYLIDCGSPTNTSVADRVFLSDYAASKFLSTSQDVVATAANNLIVSSSDSPLYQTARIFIQTSRYTFPIRQHGRHWIRLYFSSFVYENYDMSTASFSVFTENRVLLKDFRTCNATSFKEFSVNVASKNLEIALAPSTNSFAFLNAIEVVSVPDELITDDLVPMVGPLGQNFEGLSSRAFETVERVNMGGPMVFPENDTLWRTWVPEQPFLVHKNMVINVSNIEAVKYIAGGKVTPNIAPASVYGTGTTIDYRYVLNITWQFEVDQEFCYLIRFHFCDIMNKKLHTLFFNVYVNSWIVASDMDTSALSSNSLGTPFYRDYVTRPLVTNKLSVSIGSSSFRNDRPDGILNGLEILKINNSMGNFDSQVMSSATKKKVGALAIGASIGGFLVVAISVVLFLIVCKNEKRQALKGHSKTTANALDSLKYGTCIPFLVVQEATNNFDDGWIIGSGGFGKVYKGVLIDGTKVAVKRKNPGSQQGLAEFWTEIKMLSQFRHRNLVSLIAYCDEGNEMILVYEYVENGTLRSHLYGSGVLPVLSWKQRLEICVGAAKGLHYLHTGFARAIIHRDVKSTNILLDENLKAKVADFGLSKIGPDIMKANHVSTAVKGSFGYLDP
ncbi:hypothetical protein TIFTF001_016280, partial [Ficus carica]